MSDDNVRDMPNQGGGKPAKSFDDVLRSVNGEMAEARAKAIKARIKTVLDKKAEAEKLIRGYDEELDQLRAQFDRGLL